MGIGDWGLGIGGLGGWVGGGGPPPPPHPQTPNPQSPIPNPQSIKIYKYIIIMHILKIIKIKK